MEIFLPYFRGYLWENCGKWNKKCELTVEWEQKLRESRGSGDNFYENTAVWTVGLKYVFYPIRQLVTMSTVTK